jgi:hypothetical protein
LGSGGSWTLGERKWRSEMANSTPAGIKVEYDNDVGSLVDISQFVLTINEISVESAFEEVHSFGDEWEEWLPVGIGKSAQIELGGLYDDSVGGPDDVFADRVPEVPGVTPTRTLKITWVGTKTTTFETYLVAYKRQPDRNALTKWTATLQPTGSFVEV